MSDRIPEYKDKPHLMKNYKDECLGKNNKIFVGSMIDMWADDIPHYMIYDVLEKIAEFPENEYYFYTKNPKRYLDMQFNIYNPQKCYFGVTIETTNSNYRIGSAPDVKERKRYMVEVGDTFQNTCMSIEPVMPFITHIFYDWIKEINPLWVSIGANTNKSVKLKQPGIKQVKCLIKLLESDGIDVREKKNMGMLERGGMI
jgi:DNA repair photolyase